MSPACLASSLPSGGLSSKAPASSGDPLKPYTSLCADRLKITGSANWNPLPFLASDPDLQFAFLEPDVLLYGGEPPA